MPRRAKGPRLWFREDRGTWFILDGSRQRGTGLGPGQSAEAEKALTAYLAEKHAATPSGKRDPSQIPIDDVLALYVRDMVPRQARPQETATRIKALRRFWAGRALDYVTGASCRQYAASRSTAQAARRELEDLRSAINHHRREGLHDRLVTVVLPDRAPRRERWLTKKEAARLILSAWRYREKQNARATDRATRKHVARFMVVSRYMGSRAAVICGASIEEKRPPDRAWVDLTTGSFYGRPAGERETKKRKQTVPVPLPLLAHMRRWRANGQRYVVQWNGKAVTRVDKAHRAVCLDAGMSDVTPHVWRHSVATWLLMSGVKRATVADWLAMSEGVLERVYSHLEPGSFEDVHGAL